MNVLKIIKNVFDTQQLSIALSGYSAEAVKAAIAQSTLNETQIRAILVEKGFTGQLLETTTAELTQATSTNALAASQTGATASTLGLGTAMKGLGASMKAFALSNPILTAIAAVGVTIYGAVKAYDALTVSVEEANEAMKEAVSEYESAKSSLESINSELEEQNKQLDELLAKDKLTYAEKGQLEELQAITKELLLQQDIAERNAERASREAADKAVDAYEKQYGSYGISKEALNGKFDHIEETGIFPLSDGENDIVGNIAAYVRATELLEEAYADYEEALKNGEDAALSEDDIQYYIDMVDDYSEALDSGISDLQEKRLALEEEYDRAIRKREAGNEPLTTSDKEIIETYESIYDVMKLVYEYTDQNAWNDMEISNIFNTEGIEKTKDELIAMAKAGELIPETVTGYENLNDAIQDSELFLKDGQTAAEAFCDEIYGCVDAAEILDDALDVDSPTLSISDTISQLNTRLKPTFDSLKSAYQDIFTDDGFNLICNDCN